MYFMFQDWNIIMFQTKGKDPYLKWKVEKEVAEILDCKPEYRNIMYLTHP